MLESYFKSFLTQRNHHNVVNLKNKLTFRIIIILMIINTLVSLIILREQSSFNIFFNVYYESLNKNTSSTNLLTKLNSYRQQSHSKLNNFSTFLINNQNLCLNKKTNDNILLTFLIHSHRNNFIRRKAMRDTWLLNKQYDLFDLFSSLNNQGILDEKDLKILLNFNKKKINLVHLFVLGNGKTNKSMNKIQQESDFYKDILLIDMIENYHNLIHKHLAILDWVVNYCPQATYVIKLDDDVFVNIKQLSKHLITNLESINYENHNKHLMHCSIIDKGIPARSKKSKWFVDHLTYPFKYYPKYCEGFSYITNVPTIKLMYEQAKLIPRFWIDDVYVTGLLLYGIDSIKWIDYKANVPVSVYDFWNHNSSLFRIYSILLSLFNYDTSYFYKIYYFVVLHADNVNIKEYDYDNVENNFNCVNSSNQSCSDQVSQLKSNDSKFYNFCVQLNQN